MFKMERSMLINHVSRRLSDYKSYWYQISFHQGSEGITTVHADKTKEAT